MHNGHDLDLATPREHFFGPNHGIHGVVAAFDDDIGPGGQDKFERGGLIEDYNSIHGGEGSQDPATLALPHDGTAGPLQRTYRNIAIDGHNEAFPETVCFFQDRDMANVEQVKAAVGEHNPLAIGFPQGHSTNEILPADYLVLGVQGEFRGQRG